MLPRVSWVDHLEILKELELSSHFKSFKVPLLVFCRMWKVFYDDVNRPNRYLLAKEQPTRPDATEIEVTMENCFSPFLVF